MAVQSYNGYTGQPITVVLASTSLNTALPMPTTLYSPMRIRSFSIAPLPMNAFSPITAAVFDLQAVNVAEYTWDDAERTVGNVLKVSPAVTTRYLVNVKGTNGCERGQYFTVAVNNLPSVQFNTIGGVKGDNEAACLGSAVDLYSGGSFEKIFFNLFAILPVPPDFIQDQNLANQYFLLKVNIRFPRELLIRNLIDCIDQIDSKAAVRHN